jgi:hypothetical protein
VSVCDSALLFSGVGNKGGGLLAAHVFLQKLRLGPQQVDDDQAVDDTAEAFVDVETQPTAPYCALGVSCCGAGLVGSGGAVDTASVAAGFG